MITSLVRIERFLPGAPALLIAVATGIIGVQVLGLHAHGVELVGQGLPSITLQEFSLAEMLWPGALGIALMSFTESIAAGRARRPFEQTQLAPSRSTVCLTRNNREIVSEAVEQCLHGAKFVARSP